MKKIIMIVACLCILNTSVIAEERLECFVIDDKEICLTHEEILTLIQEFSEVLKNSK